MFLLLFKSILVENFKDLTERRQTEALRSVILEIDTKDICGQVYHHCKQFGEIKNAFIYKLRDERNLMLVEYKNVEAVKETFKFSGFQLNTVHWPNRVLTVRNSKLNPSLFKDAPLQIDNAVEPKIADILRSAKTFDEQVDLLYEHTKLSDLSIRLKYITALHEISMKFSPMQKYTRSVQRSMDLVKLNVIWIWLCDTMFRNFQMKMIKCHWHLREMCLKMPKI